MNTLRIRTSLDYDPDEPPCLRTHLLVDEQPIIDLVRETLAINYFELLRSLEHAGEYFIITCSCGDAGCAGITEGVRVTHNPTNIQWVVRGHGPTQTLYFDKEHYSLAIERGLNQLKQLVHAHPEIEIVPHYHRTLAQK